MPQKDGSLCYDRNCMIVTARDIDYPLSVEGFDSFGLTLFIQVRVAFILRVAQSAIRTAPKRVHLTEGCQEG